MANQCKSSKTTPNLGGYTWFCQKHQNHDYTLILIIWFLTSQFVKNGTFIVRKGNFNGNHIGKWMLKILIPG